MPTIFDPKDLAVRQEGKAARTTLADKAMLGTNALQVERVVLEASGNTSPVPAMNVERFIYVIRGTGQAHVGKETYPLEPESILWIEPGDSYSLEASAEQLEILICRAPADG